MSLRKYNSFAALYNESQTSDSTKKFRTAVNASAFGLSVIYGFSEGASDHSMKDLFVDRFKHQAAHDTIDTAVKVLWNAAIATRIGIGAVRGANIASAYHTKSQLQPDSITFKRASYPENPDAQEIITVVSEPENTRLMRQAGGAVAGGAVGLGVSAAAVSAGLAAGYALGELYRIGKHAIGG